MTQTNRSRLLARRTVFETPGLRRVLPWLARVGLRAFGWRCVGAVPVPRCVLIVAPHTSNWDLPVMLAVALALGVPVHWLGKAALFRGPARAVFRWLGGIPVDRSRPNALVAQAAAAFEHAERLVLAIPPEGTRGRTRGWRSGFYHIATTARVPVVMSFADFASRRAGVGPLLEPSGDLEADMAKVREFYSTIKGRRPELQSEIVIVERSTGAAARGRPTDGPGDS